MFNPDIINSLFPLGGTFFMLYNVKTLLEHKSVRGVSVSSAAFFWLWSLWNTVFFSSLQLEFSWYSSIGVLLANSSWVSLMLYYKFKNRDVQEPKSGI